MILIVLESSPTYDYYDIIIIIMLINMIINIIDDDYYYDNPIDQGYIFLQPRTVRQSTHFLEQKPLRCYSRTSPTIVPKLRKYQSIPTKYIKIHLPAKNTQKKYRHDLTISNMSRFQSVPISSKQFQTVPKGSKGLDSEAGILGGRLNVCASSQWFMTLNSLNSYSRYSLICAI